MIDSSPAIEKVKSKVIYVKRTGFTAIVADGKTADGKWHVIDVIIGNLAEAVAELREAGYTVRAIK